METEVEEHLYLRALLEHYRSIDCWCGDDFNGVVESYLMWPRDAEDLEYLEADTYRALARTATLTAEQRRLGLHDDIERLLQTARDERTRLGVIVNAGGKDLLEFSDFWLPADGDASAFPATLFLVLTRAYAKESESERDPFDKVARQALLEAAERDAERLTNER